MFISDPQEYYYELSKEYEKEIKKLKKKLRGANKKIKELKSEIQSMKDIQSHNKMLADTFFETS